MSKKKKQKSNTAKQQQQVHIARGLARQTRSRNPAPRNLVALNPLLKKGGVHEPSKKSRRRKAKDNTKRMAQEWLDRSCHALSFI